MTNLLKSAKLKRPMKVLDASSMLSIKGGKKTTGQSGSIPPPGE